MIKMLIDCDPGHDDALAILMALAHPERFKVLGITTIGGNQTLEKVTKNALKIVSIVKKDIPVVAGAEGPLLKTLTPAPEAHGDTGMDGPNISEDDILYQAQHQNAIEFLKHNLEQSNDNLTIVALGPLTNIALLIKTFPEIKHKIKEIALMGGSIYSGNSTCKAEFNFYTDPHAAKIVFDSGIPIIMAGLEVSHAASIYHTEIELLREKGIVSQFAYELLNFYTIFSKKLGNDKSPIFDACPIMYLWNPNMFEATEYHVDIDISNGPCEGMSVVDTRQWFDMPVTNALVLENVDRELFIKTLIEACEILDKEV